MSSREPPEPIFDVDVETLSDEELERLLTSSDIPFNLRQRLRAERADRVEAEIEAQEREQRREQQREEERRRRREQEEREARRRRALEWARHVRAELGEDFLERVAEHGRSNDFWRELSAPVHTVASPFAFDISLDEAVDAAEQVLAAGPEQQTGPGFLEVLLGGRRRVAPDGGVDQRATVSGALAGDLSLLELIAIGAVAFLLLGGR